MQISAHDLSTFLNSTNALYGEDPNVKSLRQFAHLLQQHKPTNLKYVLPFVFNLKGAPYTLHNHFPFEPMFDLRQPQAQVWRTARQVSKSTSIASRGVLLCNAVPDFTILYLAPLFEMTRRLSNNVVRPFVERSPIKRLWTGINTENNVLQRSFRNFSKMIFSFAYLDVERVRGISADCLFIDEVQDFDPVFIPIVKETMSASKWGLTQYTGTPKTLENTIEGLWQRSSKAEWCIRCEACNHWNIPALSHDLDNMIGENWEEASEEKPAVVCAKCKRSVNPRTGRWVHAEPALRWDFAGYHVPQIIMPMHYADAKKWKILLGKRAGSGNISPHVFYNEVLGESYDVGAKLVTVTDLRNAAVLHKNDLETAKTTIGNYTHRVLSVDWGGGGEDWISFTTVAVLGLSPDGVIDVIYGWRSLRPHDSIYEATEILKLLAAFKCSHLVHDYSGAGNQRHSFIILSGFPEDRIVPISYVRPGVQGLMKFVPATPEHPVNHWRLVKAQSLEMICNLIKLKQIRFFAYDHNGEDDAGLLHDFLTLVAEKSEARFGSDNYTIIRDATSKNPDDFAQAVNMGACALYYMSQRWPNMAQLAQLRVEQAALTAGNELANAWDDLSQQF